MKNKLAEWDAPMSQIVSLTATSALSSLIFLSQFWRNAGVHLRENLLVHDLKPPTWVRGYGDY